MDNISGKANWTLSDVPVKKASKLKELEPKEKVCIDLPKLPLIELVSFTHLVKTNYELCKKKEFGDAILHLEIANKLLS